MRHRKTQRKLGRNSAHRQAMYRNMAASLLEHERITTTLHKAKELRSYAERTITLGLRLGELLQKPREERSREEQMRYASAMGLVARRVSTQTAVNRLFSEVAPRLRGRAGGYTRIYRLGRRAGDGAELAIIELVCREPAPKAAAAEASTAEA